VPPPKQSALPILLILLVIVVVAIVAIAAIGLFFVASQQTQGGVTMTVNDIAPYEGENVTGREWVVVEITMSNDRDYDLVISQIFFTLKSGGEDCSPVLTLTSEYPVPSSVAPGRSATFEMVFDIPEGSEPERLVFNNILSEVAVDL